VVRGRWKGFAARARMGAAVSAGRRTCSPFMMERAAMLAGNQCDNGQLVVSQLFGASSQIDRRTQQHCVR
jgi:hypothetical protein